ncbi:hypothetical protein D9619_006759 [Psilocybe cf. subviscida]|uniref:Lysine-specific metallo-endopeptidase domain-containing protein n=1 Tax=Psilocybe cf. subviscida TaxID=2480587 RepID=A0A8H5EXB4_9AGAR|nr:hypothetical protein D9619_006759 [Psilocybe cf. subviscida]
MVSIHTYLLAFASLAVNVSAAESLYMRVSGPTEVDGVENMQVVVTVTNTGNETLKILNDPRGPLSTRPTNTFSITDASGAKPAFTGIKLKYVPKTAVAVGAFTILAPGKSIQVEHAREIFSNHHLSDCHINDTIFSLFVVGHAYNFSLSGAATYDIHANNAFLIVNESNTVSTISADSEAHTIKVAGRSNKLAAVHHAPIAKRASYNGCTSSQQTAVVSAASAAQSYASSAYSYASSHSSSTNRYTTWFGTFTTARHSTVLSHFQNLNSNTFSNFTFDCTCTDIDTYAYVYPDSFGYIYLCGAFWGTPNTGTDSKGGTLIHEASHFTSNGGTDDYAYGQSNAKSLASSNPNEAIFNADSHEYYAENNPALA